MRRKTTLTKISKKKKKKRKLNIDKIAEKIRAKFGEDAITTLAPNQNQILDIPSISTGVECLDNVLEIGGVPRGKIIEIFGNESSGKTTLCLHIIKTAQELGCITAYIDAEHALDAKYAKAIGVDLSKMLVNQPESGERALDIAIDLIKKKVDIVVVDSVAALVPEKELSGDMDKKSIGLQARMMGQALRKLTHIVKESNTAVIFINQVRDKIGVMFGDKTTTPGGRALKFWAHLRLNIARIKTLKHKGKKNAILARVIVRKSKVSTPYRQCEFTIEFGKGIV